MKKTIVFEFPDDFSAPKHYDGSCCCPFNTEGRGPYCMLTGDRSWDEEQKLHVCPLYCSGDNILHLMCNKYGEIEKAENRK